MAVRRFSARIGRRVSTAVWILGTLSLLAVTLARWIAAPPSLAVPWTPVDRTNALYARQWMLVLKAHEVIPAGQTYTAIASDPDSEMLLYMLSLDLFTDHVPIPSSYFRVAFPGGAAARYVIAYDCVVPEGALLLRRFPEGCVWERPTPRT
jgi:hypothetical protein